MDSTAVVIADKVGALLAANLPTALAPEGAAITKLLAQF